MRVCVLISMRMRLRMRVNMIVLVVMMSVGRHGHAGFFVGMLLAVLFPVFMCRMSDDVQQRTTDQRLEPQRRAVGKPGQHGGFGDISGHRHHGHEEQHHPRHHPRAIPKHPPHGEPHRDLMQQHAIAQQTARLRMRLGQRAAVEHRMHGHAEQCEREDGRVCLTHAVAQHPLDHAGHQIPQRHADHGDHIAVLQGMRHHVEQDQSADRHHDETVDECCHAGTRSRVPTEQRADDERAQTGGEERADWHDRTIVSQELQLQLHSRYLSGLRRRRSLRSPPRPGTDHRRWPRASARHAVRRA